MKTLKNLSLVAALTLLTTTAAAQCIELVDPTVECLTVADSYRYTFSVFNDTSFIVDRVFIWPDPATSAVFSVTDFLLDPPLSPGQQSSALQLDFENVTSGAECFDVSAHDTSTGSCCGTTVCADIPSCSEIIRGDCNNDGGLISLGDVIAMLSYLFLSGTIDCESSCDFNDDGTLGLTDAIGQLNYLFLNGNSPTAPFPGCGADPTDDSLACDMFGCP